LAVLERPGKVLKFFYSKSVESLIIVIIVIVIIIINDVICDQQANSEQLRWYRVLLRLCGHVMMRDDVIPTSCVIAAVGICLHLAVRYTTHLVTGPSPLPVQLTGMLGAVASLRAHAAACDDRGGAVDVAALDAWYHRHMTFEIVNLAGALRYFADGRLTCQ